MKLSLYNAAFEVGVGLVLFFLACSLSSCGNDGSTCEDAVASWSKSDFLVVVRYDMGDCAKCRLRAFAVRDLVARQSGTEVAVVGLMKSMRDADVAYANNAGSGLDSIIRSYPCLERLMFNEESEVLSVLRYGVRIAAFGQRNSLSEIMDSVRAVMPVIRSGP